jgi:hypothetical protein
MTPQKPPTTFSYSVGPAESSDRYQPPPTVTRPRGRFSPSFAKIKLMAAGVLSKAGPELLRQRRGPGSLRCPAAVPWRPGEEGTASGQDTRVATSAAPETTTAAHGGEVPLCWCAVADGPGTE